MSMLSDQQRGIAIRFLLLTLTKIHLLNILDFFSRYYHSPDYQCNHRKFGIAVHLDGFAKGSGPVLWIKSNPYASAFSG